MIRQRQIDINDDGNKDTVYVIEHGNQYVSPYGLSDKPYYFTTKEEALQYDKLVIVPSTNWWSVFNITVSS